MSKESTGPGKPKRLGRGLSALVQTSVPIEPSPRSPGGRAPRSDPSGLGSGGSGASQAEVKPITPGRSEPESSGSEFQWLPVDSVSASPFQPRTNFDSEAIHTLGESIKRSGMMQPLVVRPVQTPGENRSSRYELVAGERRWRAAKDAGLERVPAIVRLLGDQEAAELALVENLQRRDLNAIERAFAFRRLSDQFGLSQEQIGERVGLDRSSVSNFMRLTELEEEIRDMIATARLGSGHGKVLLGFDSGSERLTLARRAADESWSVRRLEREASNDVTADGKASKTERPEPSPALVDLEQQLSHHLGTRVRIRTDKSGTRGAMSVEFYSLDQFDGLLGQLGFTPPSV